MTFVKPMLAAPGFVLTDSGLECTANDDLPGILARGGWVAEEKYDGLRIVVSVNDPGLDLFGRAAVRAWSRWEKERVLPARVREALALLPTGTYDGELHAPGTRSYGASTLANAGALVYTVFDVTSLLGRDVTKESAAKRRAFLVEIFARLGKDGRIGGCVELGWSRPVASVDDVLAFAEEVCSRDGEGLVLKRSAGAYGPGKRSKDWRKVKARRTTVLECIGYVAGLMGPHATVLLRDDEGNETTVKTLDRKELARLDANPSSFVGRKMRIEYQERTPDGGYRHGQWDRWEDE